MPTLSGFIAFVILIVLMRHVMVRERERQGAGEVIRRAGGAGERPLGADLGTYRFAPLADQRLVWSPGRAHADRRGLVVPHGQRAIRGGYRAGHAQHGAVGTPRRQKPATPDHLDLADAQRNTASAHAGGPAVRVSPVTWRQQLTLGATRRQPPLWERVSRFAPGRGEKPAPEKEMGGPWCGRPSVQPAHMLVGLLVLRQQGGRCSRC